MAQGGPRGIQGALWSRLGELTRSLVWGTGPLGLFRVKCDSEGGYFQRKGGARSGCLVVGGVRGTRGNYLHLFGLS